MLISIIGSGRVGGVLGRRWAEAGHTIRFGSRDLEKEELKKLAKHPAISIHTPSESVNGVEVVLLAVPVTAIEQVVMSLGTLTGKIVIDCTNPIGAGFTFDKTRDTTGRIKKMAPGAYVVKAFNTTGSTNMDNPSYDGIPLVLPICGDDEAARKVVGQLASELGFEPMDAGGLEHAYLLEAFAFLWLNQAFGQGWGDGFGFSVHKR